MGEALMKFPIFAKAIEKCDAALKPHGVDIVDIITTKDKNTIENIINCFVGISAIQIGLVDLLSAAGIKPDNIIGHSLGELGCAYADNCFTAEQMVLAAYFRGRASLEYKMTYGSMAAIGLSLEETKDLCPPDIDVACHNSSDSCTISGPAESMKEFLAKLQFQAKNIFAKEVACGNIAFHSRYIAGAGEKLLESLKKVIPKPKLRSSKWISTSVPRNKWNTEAAKYSSAEYHTNNLLSPVFFAEMSTMIPSDAITVEIAPHGLLQAILRRSLDENTTNIPLTQRGHRDNVEFFSQALGKLYNAGLQPQLSNLYPRVEFPVSRGTPMISPYIKWEHSSDFFVPTFTQRQKIAIAERTIEISVHDDAYEYMTHHVIDGRNLIPATGYLIMVWETFSLLQAKLYDAVSVVFENVRFERATSIPTEGSITLIVAIHRGSGKFEVSDNSTTVVTGRIREPTNITKEKIPANCLKQIQDDEILTTKDIYKEFNLRSYQYSGIFRGIKSSSINGTRGHIAWFKNWAAFMDNMLQMELLTLDTRALYVPTAIQKIVIDVVAHNEKIRLLTAENNGIPVSVYRNYNAIISGGIEIHRLKASSIQRRKPPVDPVLEEYKFVANRDRAQVSLEQMIILSTQIALENHITNTPKFLELINQEDKLPVDEILTPVIMKTLGNLPMICPSFNLAAKAKQNEKLPIDEKVTLIEPSRLPEDGSIFMVVAYNILSNKRSDILEQILRATVDHGFVLLRENVVNKDTFSQLKAYELDTVLEKTFNNQTLLLIRKEAQPPQKTEVVYVKNNEFSWVEKVKAVLNSVKDSAADGTVRLVLVGEGDMESGVLGMVKCLRREIYGEMFKALIIQDENAPKFSLSDPFYSKQLDLDIGYNVLRPNGVWGTYRHVPYSEPKPVPVAHGYADMKVKGNLSSFQWVQGPIQPNTKNEYQVKVIYSSINFRDVMLATGKLSPEAVTQNRRLTDCLIGFEYSGIDNNGRRVMGFVESRGLSNIVTPNKHTIWPVPDEWTLEEAATVPSAYFTVFYAFYQFGKLKKGEKVLIHAGSGAVGQAAIHVALSEGCEVFTTVGTDEKRKFIRNTFPSVSDDHIGNSRDTSFEQMVMDLTDGKGVDIVLNSLSEDKLQASIRCLGYRGRFLEIGKFDMAANNEIGLEIFLKEISFHGIILDSLFNGNRTELQSELHHFLTGHLNGKVIKPLVRKCFEKNQLEDAFRYMAAGKHIGKILIKIADERESFDTPIIAEPRFYAVKNKTYVLVGGLGGLGLELVDWLILRGARNLVIASRNGIKTGYQKWRTEIWKSYGVKVLIISNVDMSKRTDCEFVLKSAEKQAPVDGIFNLAAILKDCLMENQTVETFEESMKPKARITKQLDELSRKICPNLRHFIVFSSLSCGRGTAGQGNYGLGNAVMERICERRVEKGLPGMAIQWGAVGDVGLAAEMSEDNKELVIGGTLPQKISSCLEELDKFMVQSKPIVASMIVAEKRAGVNEASNVLEAVMNIMNIKDLKTIGQCLSLAELGMDSMMAVEIKQTLERDFDVFLTPQDIRSLNIPKLMEMSVKDVKITKQTAKRDKHINVKETALVGSQMLVNTLNLAILSDQQCVKLNVKHVEKTTEVILIPGIEGSTEIFLPLTSLLKYPATCLQLIIDNTAETVEDMAKNLLPHVLARIKGTDFIIVAYSFGTLIALEIVKKLEELGLVGQLIFIDGSPDYTKALKLLYVTGSTEEERQHRFLNDMLIAMKSPMMRECQLELAKCTTWGEKLEKISEYAPDQVRNVYSKEGVVAIIDIVYKRLTMIDKYNPSTASKLRTPIVLLVPTLSSVEFREKDYGLSKFTYGRITVHQIKGNHLSMMDNTQIAKVINGDPLEDEESYKETLLLKTDGANEAIIA
ncbi:fatty acid synthase-like [Xylocopa sonorina]|uniref:fatty acid synthase-like n=1 Tax=Xylocopa sonorina TaxID=1818115 RepID=UPI00403ACEBE